MATEYWKIKRNYATTEAGLSLIARQWGHAEDTGRLVVMRADGVTKDYFYNSVSLAKQTSTYGSQLIGTGPITGVAPSGGSVGDSGTVYSMLQGVYNAVPVLAPSTEARNRITSSADVTNLTLRAMAAQTSYLQLWQSSAGTSVAGMATNGDIFARSVSAFSLATASDATISGNLAVTGSATYTPLVGTGIRLVTSTAAGVLGNATTIAGANEFTALQAFGSGVAFSGNGVTATATIFRTAADGLSMRGVAGSTNDLGLWSAGGSLIMRNPTGGTVAAFPGTGVTMAGTLAVTGAVTLSNLSAARIPLVSTAGLLTQDNFYWVTGGFMGIGSSATTPTNEIYIAKTKNSASVNMVIQNYGTGTAEAAFALIASNGTGDTRISFDSTYAFSLGVDYSLGKFVIMAGSGVLGAGTDALTIDSSALVVAKASMKVEGNYVALPQRAGDPSSPANGWIYYDNTSGHIRGYVAGVWGEIL